MGSVPDPKVSRGANKNRGREGKEEREGKEKGEREEEGREVRGVTVRMAY